MARLEAVRRCLVNQGYRAPVVLFSYSVLPALGLISPLTRYER
jgi:hypothetical protein